MLVAPRFFSSHPEDTTAKAMPRPLPRTNAAKKYMLNIAKAAKSRNPPKASIPKHPNAGIPKLHKSLSELFPVPPKPPKFQPPPFPPAVRRDTEAVPKVIPQALLKQKMKQDNPTDLDDALYKGNYDSSDAEHAEDSDYDYAEDAKDAAKDTKMTEHMHKKRHAPNRSKPTPKSKAYAMMLDATKATNRRKPETLRKREALHEAALRAPTELREALRKALREAVQTYQTT